jgi:hypothetical protein
MIRLYTPFPPSPVSKLSLFLSLPVCRRSSLEGGGRGGGMEPNHMTAKKLGPLYIVQPHLRPRLGKIKMKTHVVIKHLSGKQLVD